MKVILNAGPLPKRYRNIVAAIGVFDGVHQGHQRVISRAVAEAGRLKGVSVVVTFFPHPVEVLHPGKFNGYVISLEHRFRLIASLGADICYVLPFSRSFAGRTAADFAGDFLVKKLRAIKVVVGEDFHFGKRREGTAGFFAGMGIAVETVPLLKVRGIEVKTSLLKKLIVDGDLPRLKVFLKRDYGVFAEVEHGKGFGRRLGFPTANLKRGNVLPLPSGIYVVRVIVGAKNYQGVFYIGLRPSLHRPSAELALEAHLLDFKGDLYGRKIGVEFLRKLRNDCVFPDSCSLSKAIARDVMRARAFFQRHPAPGKTVVSS